MTGNYPGNFTSRSMSGNVVSVISESGIVENVGVAARTALSAPSVYELFPVQVFVAAILRS